MEGTRAIIYPGKMPEGRLADYMIDGTSKCPRKRSGSGAPCPDLYTAEDDGSRSPRGTRGDILIRKEDIVMNEDTVTDQKVKKSMNEKRKQTVPSRATGFLSVYFTPLAL